MTDAPNDNDTARAIGPESGPDAHGQAAILLVESLLHGLIARSVVNVDEAVEIVSIAADVKKEVAAEMGDSPATMAKSLTILGAIRSSLSADQPDGRGTSSPDGPFSSR